MTKPTIVERDFDGVSALLLEWNGRRVAAGVDGPGDGRLMGVRGELAAGREMVEPYNDDEFEFGVGDEASFTQHRGYFDGADYFPDSSRLIVALRDAGNAPPAATTYLHIVAHA